MWTHGTALGETDAYLLHVNQLVEQEVQAGIGQRGVAYGRPYALEVLLVQLFDTQLFVCGIAPVLLAHRFVHAFGSSLGQTVGQQLCHHFLIGVVLEFGFHTDVGTGGKEAYAVAGGPDEVSQRQIGSPTGLLAE